MGGQSGLAGRLVRAVGAEAHCGWVVRLLVLELGICGMPRLLLEKL